MGNMGKHNLEGPADQPGQEPTPAAPHQAATLEPPRTEVAPAGVDEQVGGLPGTTAEVEAQRRKTLRNHKAFVTGLLVVAAIIFLWCSWYDAQPGGTPGWVGYVRAAAEAGMIGGLADWFAVTALFRHPMGLKIPHTAIIPRKKDQLGAALSSFVGENFLNADLITEKVSKAKIPERVGQWLAEPENAEKVSREAGKLTANAVAALDPADAEAVINAAVIEKLAEPQWGPPAGRMLQQLIEDGKTEPIIDGVVKWAHEKALGAEEMIVTLVDQRKPVWAPKFVNNLIGERVYKELIKFTTDVAANPDHEARNAIRRWLEDLAVDLQEDPVMIDRVEGWKADLMASRSIQSAGATIWASTSAAVIEAARDPESLLRQKITELSLTWGKRIQEDQELRVSLDRRITGAAAFLANNYSGEVTAIISETVERWDASEASEKIELMVGKDLQFIRLNGTLVGALAGLIIYTVSQLLFGT
ncbi:hypothetical protein COCCU_01840 [Corynebacterium occultum]|uniref:DUF445 domain-containing protein n=2 Tax=Corynebacterium occultum TaxID=2675219 RepID=A0A6B8W2X7_9CORY|nr:hypothetical protein COCCU_01840 [Corynebacterium occultum]